MNENELVKKILKEFSQRPIAYYPIYSEITEHLISGILLSQLIYWHYKMDEKEFYKTDANFADELKMSIKEVRSAKKILVQHRVIDYKAKGVPAKTWYKIDMDRIIQLIASYSGQTSLPQKDKLEPPQRANKNSPKGQTINHRLPETTTKNKTNNQPNNISSVPLNKSSDFINLEGSNNIPSLLTKDTSKDKVNTSKKDLPKNPVKNPERQKLIDQFYVDYEKLYGNKLNFDGKELGSIKNLLKKNPKELQEKYKTLLAICRDKPDDFHRLLPSVLLGQWNKLVKITSAVRQDDNAIIEVVPGSAYEKRLQEGKQ